MATRTYFGRVDHGERHLGADFDLLAKWSRAFSLGIPMNSYSLTQLSDDDRSKLFTGPAAEFRLQEGPNNTVKLQTVMDAQTRIDPDVIAMMRSDNYLRSEARHLELLTEIESAQDAAQGAAALALSGALLKGMDGPPAEKLAKKVEDRILDAAARKVRLRWKAARVQRLIDTTTPSPDLTSSALSGTDSTLESRQNLEATVHHGPDSDGSLDAERERLATLAVGSPLGRAPHITLEEVNGRDERVPGAKNAATVGPQVLRYGDDMTTPKHKSAASFASPADSLPDYGSETSAESAHWSSPKYSSGESPSSPDLDSISGPMDEADGGVALLPSSLAAELGLTDQGDVATPTPSLRLNRSQTQASEGHLGTGLGQAFFSLPAGIYSMSAGVAANFAAVGGGLPQTCTTYPASSCLGSNVKTTEASPGPFSPNAKTGTYPVAKEQPWKGFICYDVDHKLSCDHLVPRYWTTKRGKERYLRHKLGELKLDDAKLRSDRFAGAVARNPIHIFVDLSNIVIGFYDSMKESRGIPVTKRVMAPHFSFRNFDTILTRDRNVAKRIVAGSLSNSYNKRWPGYMLQAQELQYEMNILERVPKPASPMRKRKPKAGSRELDHSASGADTSGDDCVMGPMRHGEQGVDELLHLKILQSAMDTLDPATMVLATGDAASAQYSDGFKKNIERVLAKGWIIELYGWSRNISSAWREPEFAERWGHQFKIVELDGFCEELFDMTIESLEH